MFLVRPGGQSQYKPYALAASGNIAAAPRTAGWMIENLRENLLALKDLLNEWE